MKNVITAMGNQLLNNELTKEEEIQIITQDIPYQDGILEMLETNKKIDTILISDEILGELTLEKLIKEIKNIKPEIEIILFTKKQIKLEIKDNIYIIEKEKIEIKEIVYYICKKNISENNKIIINKENSKKEINKINISNLLNKLNFKTKSETQIISILGAGGTGKSITCVNLANSLKNSKNKILILDFDILNNSLSTILGVNQYSKKIINKLKNNTVITNQIKIKDLIIKIDKKIDLISGINLMFDTKYQISSKKIKDILIELKQYYDFIIIDTSCECFFDYTKEIIKNSTKSIFLMEANLLEIKKAKTLLEIYTKEWQIQNNKINLLINKMNENATDEKIIKNIFSEFNILGKINYHKEYNAIINKNNKIKENKKIKKEYVKINNKILKVNFDKKTNIVNIIKQKLFN